MSFAPKKTICSSNYCWNAENIKPNYPYTPHPLLSNQSWLNNCAS